MSSPDGQLAVRVECVTKSYGGSRVLETVTFDIPRGEIFALLGPNGAGKTTTVEILEGYRAPDTGKVRVLGWDPIADSRLLKPHIGVMLQDGGLPPAMTPREALRLFANFYAHSLDPIGLLGSVGLDASANTTYRRLSGGQKQRLSLALALLPQPQLLFLDEPTTGLDPQARRATWDLISMTKAQGATVVLTTHYLEEAERLADRIAILDEGRLVALDTPARLLSRDRPTVHLRTAEPVQLRLLHSLPSAQAIHVGAPSEYTIETHDAPALLVEVATLLQNRGPHIVELRVGGGSLEEVFLRVTGKEFHQ